MGDSGRALKIYLSDPNSSTLEFESEPLFINNFIIFIITCLFFCFERIKSNLILIIKFNINISHKFK